jgi:hypothetical protein
MASWLRTPLQHLTLALETGYQASEKPVSEAIVDSVLSKQLDDLEPTLTRHGYTAKVLTEMLGTKPGEIKALIKDPRPKGRGIPRRDGEPFSYGGELDVGLADARA